MAIDYTTNPTGIFFRGGKLLKAINDRNSRYATIRAELASVVDPFEAADAVDGIQDLYQQYDSEQTGTTGLRRLLASKWDAIFAERVTLETLDLLDFDEQSFFPAFWAQMIADSKTIEETVAALGTATITATGTGTVLQTLRLDGVTPPVVNGPAVPGYALNGPTMSEVCGTETFTLTCVRDRYSGATAGSEEFQWVGSIEGDEWGEDALAGSGEGPTLNCIGNDNVLANGDFEEFTTANLPDDWTKVSGTVGTHIAADTVTFYRGSSCVKFIGDGSTATIKITQAISQSQLTPLRSYFLSARVRGSTAAPAAGTLTIKLEGTGYTPHASESISLAPGSLTTSWQLLSCVVVVPASYPTDLVLAVAVTGTLTNGVSIFVDELRMVEVTYHGGIGLAIVPGQTDWLVGDKIFVRTSRSAVGVFQEFVRKNYGVQLPSDASPAIADSLAT